MIYQLWILMAMKVHDFFNEWNIIINQLVFHLGQIANVNNINIFDGSDEQIGL